MNIVGLDKTDIEALENSGWSIVDIKEPLLVGSK